MRFGRMNQTVAAAALAASFGVATLLGGAGEARAEGPVSGTGKGIVGGALLGGEVVTITLAAIGVESAWPYLVFGGVGAIGGGIGGYFVESAAPAEAPLYMLAGGMALIIPAVVATLNATAYQPPKDSIGDDPVDNQPADEPPAPDGTTTTITSGGAGARSKAPHTAKLRAPLASAPAPHIPLSIIDLHGGRVALGLPAIEVRPLYTEREVSQFGVEQGREVRVPVFRAVF
jgi:hypothetical protein